MDRIKLLETLEVVGKGLEANKLLPDFDYFHFVDGTIYAGHDDFTIVSPTAMATKDPFAVHGPTLIKMLNASKSKEAYLQLVKSKTTGNTVELGFAGNSAYEMPFTEPESYIWKRPSFSNSMILHGLREGLAACLVTCSNDLALEGFSRICISPYKNRLAFYSCDGDSLTRFITDIPTKMTTTLCIARSFADVIVKVAKGNPQFMITDEYIKVGTEDGKYEIYGKNLGPTTIDYENIIVTKVGEGALHGLIPTPGQKSLVECLDRAKVLTDLETVPTVVLVQEGAMYLSTDTKTRGMALDSLRTQHADIELSINAEKVQQALEGCTLFKFTPTCSIFASGEKLMRIVGNFEEKRGGVHDS